MAEKQKDANTEPNVAAVDAEPEKPKKKSKLVLLLGIGGIGLAAAAGGGFFIMKTLSSGPKEVAAEALATDHQSGTSAGEKPHESADKENKGEHSASEKSETEKNAAEHSKEPTGEKEAQTSADAPEAETKSTKKVSDENSFGETFEIPKMELNVGNPLENRFLRFGLSLEYHGGEEQAEELEKRLPQMRDIIISLIGRKTRMELLSPEGRENLRKQLKNTFNEVFEKPITNVYFTSFLVE